MLKQTSELLLQNKMERNNFQSLDVRAVVIAAALVLAVLTESICLLLGANCGSVHFQTNHQPPAKPLCYEDWRNESHEFWNPADGFDIQWLNRSTSNLHFFIRLKHPKHTLWSARVVYLFDVFENLFQNLPLHQHKRLLVLIGTSYTRRGYRFENCNAGAKFMAKLSTFDLARILKETRISINIKSAD